MSCNLLSIHWRNCKVFCDLNNHFNRLQLIEAPDSFRLAVETTLLELYSAIHRKKKKTQSWKNDIYEKIKTLDEKVPAFLKAVNLLKQLGDV